MSTGSVTKSSLTANIKKSRHHLQEQAENIIDSTYQDLIQRLTSSNSHVVQTLQTIKSTNDEIQKSLREDELHFISNDGKSSGIQVLGDRMERFQKVIATEEKELEVLRKQWADVQQKSLVLASEVLFEGGIEGLSTALAGDNAGCISSEQKAIVGELENRKKRWKDEIAKLSKRSIAKLKSGEEVYKPSIPYVLFWLIMHPGPLLRR